MNQRRCTRSSGRVRIGTRRAASCWTRRTRGCTRSPGRVRRNLQGFAANGTTQRCCTRSVSGCILRRDAGSRKAHYRPSRQTGPASRARCRNRGSGNPSRSSCGDERADARGCQPDREQQPVGMIGPRRSPRPNRTDTLLAQRSADHVAGVASASRERSSVARQTPPARDRSSAVYSAILR